MSIIVEFYELLVKCLKFLSRNTIFYLSYYRTWSSINLLFTIVDIETFFIWNKFSVLSIQYVSFFQFLIFQ